MLIGFRCGECTQMLFAVFVYSSESYNQFPRTHDIFHFSLRTQFSSALLVYSLSFSLCLQSTSLVCLSFNISFVITSIHSGHVQIFMQCIPFKFRLCILQCLIYFGVVTFSSYTCTFEKKREEKPTPFCTRWVVEKQNEANPRGKFKILKIKCYIS